MHTAVGSLGHLLALHVGPAGAQDRAQVQRLAAALQAATGEKVKLGARIRVTLASSRPPMPCFR